MDCSEPVNRAIQSNHDISTRQQPGRVEFLAALWNLHTLAGHEGVTVEQWWEWSTQVQLDDDGTILRSIVHNTRLNSWMEDKPLHSRYITFTD